MIYCPIEPSFAPWRKPLVESKNSVNCIGGVPHREAIPNFFFAARKFTISCQLAGLTGDFTWDFTDPTGDSTPGSNPAAMEAACAAAKVPFTAGWVRRIVKDLDFTITCSASQGDANLSVLLGAAQFQDPDDEMYYLFGNILATGGSGDHEWFAESRRGDNDHNADFLFLGSSFPMNGDGAGSAGTISLQFESGWNG